jgi:hypothetical protein
MALSDAQTNLNEKIERALSQCEANGHVQEGKITEWALLQIVDKLARIHNALLESNLPEPPELKVGR